MLETRKVYDLTVLVAEVLNSRCGQGWFPLGLQGRFISLTFQLLEAPASWAHGPFPRRSDHCLWLQPSSLTLTPQPPSFTNRTFVMTVGHQIIQDTLPTSSS